jgi:single-stranded DNA-binding protein
MPIKTSISMTGFVVSKPVLTRTQAGNARLYMKVGQEHFVRDSHGAFIPEEFTFHDLVMFRRAAERAATQFAKGDKFVAEGRVHPYTVTDDDGVISECEEFIANHIGHDSATTRYTVDRTPRVQQGPTNSVAASPSQAVPRPSPAAPAI